MKNILIIILSAVLVSLVPIHGDAKEGDLPIIKVGHVGHDHQIALYVAIEAGKELEEQYGIYFKEIKRHEVYDLYDGGRAVARVFIVRVGGGSKMPAALEQGHIEVGLGGLGPVAKFIDKGSRLKVLAPLNNDGDALILRNDFPAGTWSELVEAIKNSEKPVRIGYKAPMAVAYMILTRALDEEEIRAGHEIMDADGNPVQVITVNLQGLSNALPSLESGIVDGVVVNEPMASILEHKGIGKRVADLSTLPPEGKWEGHPCCVVAAREDALKEKRPIIKSLLKAIAAGGDLMSLDIIEAFIAEQEWTKVETEVGRMSIANVDYVIAPDKNWLTGVDTWIELMTTSGHFHKHLKGRTTEEIKARILELDTMNEALSEMQLRSIR